MLHQSNELASCSTPFRVLVVDDDDLQLRAMQRSLRGDKRIELTVATNAIDAMLQIGATQPHLVIMDVFMPGLDGIEACRRIKANPETRDVEVILASVAINAELETAARDAGARRAVAKPFEVSALLEVEEPETIEISEPVPALKTMRGADLLVGMLTEANVDVVFGLPGGAISAVHDALIDSSGRVGTKRHER